MKTTTLILSIASVLTLVGCGPRKPSDEEARNTLASQIPAILAIESAKSEFLPKGENSGVVKIIAKLRLTENLFAGTTVSSLTDNADLIEFAETTKEKANAEKVSIPPESIQGLDKAMDEYRKALKSASRVVITPAAQAGETFSFSAHTIASFDSKAWSFGAFQGTLPEIHGAPRNTFPSNAMLEGSAEIQKALTDLQSAKDALAAAQNGFIVEMQKALTKREDDIMNPVREALKVGNNWSDSSSFEGAKAPLKWTIKKISITGSSKDSKIGSITYRVESGDLAADFSGDVFRSPQTGQLSMEVRCEESPAINDNSPGIISYIFAPTNGVSLHLEGGVLTKDNQGWSFTATQSK